jgi:hypothetical protein
MLIRIGLIGVLGIAPLGQSERRWEQIRDLLGKSDLVVVAVAEEYRPVIDRLAYRKERERHPAPDPARAERYMVGVVYQMTVREVIYRHPKRAERSRSLRRSPAGRRVERFPTADARRRTRRDVAMIPDDAQGRMSSRHRA